MNCKSKQRKITRLSLSLAFVLLYTPVLLFGQNSKDLDNATLENVIQYALANQPGIQQSVIDEKITENQVKSKLADWYPQVNFNYNLQHNFIVQTSIIAGNPVKLGVRNTSAAQFSLTQQIFNRDVLLANRTKNDVLFQASQNTVNNKINLTADVSKAFYDVLATNEQIKVSDEDIVRLERSLKDAKNQYTYGLADKIDFKRATISLNNSKALKKANEEMLRAKMEYLKSIMGFPATQELHLVYDTLKLKESLIIDTTVVPEYNNRIEYQILTTQRKLDDANVIYNKWAYIPNVSLNGAYNFNFLNNNFGDLYSKNYANSYGLLTLSLPIFQGGKRKANINAAEWSLRRTDLEIVKLKLNINAEYENALAAYKSNLADLQAQQENVDLAQEVYDVIELQYRSGIKAYLEVVTAEAQLRLSRINYFNAMYQVLASKIDVQKSLGQLAF